MRKFGLAVAALALFVGAAAEAQQQTPRRGGTIRMTGPYAASFGSLDPHVTPRAQDDIVNKAIHRTLYNWDSANNKLVPELIVSQTVSADGLTYGGDVGYDVQSGRWVFGAEGEVTGSTAKVTNNPSAAGALGYGRVKAGRDLYAGARIGYAVAPRTLIYAKGGYTNQRLDLVADGTGGGWAEHRPDGRSGCRPVVHRQHAVSADRHERWRHVHLCAGPARSLPLHIPGADRRQLPSDADGIRRCRPCARTSGPHRAWPPRLDVPARDGPQRAAGADAGWRRRGLPRDR